MAYGAAACFRFRGQNDEIKCSLIMGKSRLSPLKEKSLTIPRLEIQAAIIATCMKTHPIEDSEIQPNNIYLWSDSKVALNYIKNLDTNFGSYIAHRINKIRSNTDIKQWDYIPKSFTVADDATRYIEFSKLQSDDRWFVGSDFLYSERRPINSSSTKHKINAENKTSLNTDHISESKNIVKQSNILFNSIVVSDINNSLINYTYYSSLDKLVHHLVWISKLKRNWVMCQRGEKGRENFCYLTKNYVECSLQQLFQKSQIESYPNEYSDLLQAKRVSTPSKIINLTPIFNQNLIKVGGCLQS